MLELGAAVQREAVIRKEERLVRLPGGNEDMENWPFSLSLSLSLGAARMGM